MAEVEFRGVRSDSSQPPRRGKSLSQAVDGLMHNILLAAKSSRTSPNVEAVVAHRWRSLIP